MTRSSRPNSPTSWSGIDRLLADVGRLDSLRRQRVGLLTNAACQTADGIPSAKALNAALSEGPKPGLACLFAPEHGIDVDHLAGDSVSDQRDTAHNIQVVSLYGERKAPSPEQLATIDTLVIDLRDVGVRCYTYAATAALAAGAALKAGLEVIICDRDNPLGTATDGPPLDPKFQSFLAYFAVPFIHGKTLGELVADTLNDNPNAEKLTVLASPSNGSNSTQPWVPPSPSLQTQETIQLYPGLVLFEGTNLSEGRGTPLSFRCIGAPWLDATATANAVNDWPTGIETMPCEIQPTSGEFAGASLPAVTFEQTEPQCDGFGLGVRLLCWIASAHSEFCWRTLSPLIPGSGETDAGYTIDTLLGSDSLRNAIDQGDSAETTLSRWRG